MNKSKRIYIYAADVAELTGKCIRTAYKILHKVRLMFQKQPHQLVTFDEFYKYMGSGNDNNQLKDENT